MHLILLALACLSPTFAEPTSAPPGAILSGLASSATGVAERSPVFTDVVETRLVAGTWSWPQVGGALAAPDGRSVSWREVEADADGWFTDPGLQGGWLAATVAADAESVLMLDASGHRHVYVNGEPRGGDLYELGITRVPVLLHAGRNELLFRGGRGRLRATLVPPPAPLFLDDRDVTRPDVVSGEPGPIDLGVVVVNASPTWRRGVTVSARTGAVKLTTEVPDLLPLGRRKVPIVVPIDPDIEDETVLVHLAVRDPEGGEPFELRVELHRVAASATHRRTFRSEIDGSVQYYSVTPAVATEDDGEGPRGLILSLHGAGVEASGQAAAYGAKAFAAVVAPTNRRPFGFDWEDWGRLDALEVLDRARAHLDVDPRRVYLTGHSMGGHGTWSLAANRPDLFAAIAPSAGWREFGTYGRVFAPRADDEVDRMMDRAANASRIGALEANYAGLGVYVLHGDRDETVPVSEARGMRERLGGFHANWAYYERPGAGHWWGDACLDWPPLMAFLDQNVGPAASALLRLDFRTFDCGIGSRHHWLVVQAQDAPRELSRVHAEVDPAARRLTIRTENIARFDLDLGRMADVLEPGRAVHLVVNDAELAPFAWPVGGTIRLARGGDGVWRNAAGLSPWYKHATRCGPFKDAFRNHMVFVYGTGGAPDERAWALAKARFDAETFLYRGNGSVDVVPDHAFDPRAEPDRNVILYGNAATNAVWDDVVPLESCRIAPGWVRIGDRRLEGEGLALLMIQPRKDSGVASVGLIGGTDVVGMRATNQLPYFVSGVHYPDWTVLSSAFLAEGADGILGAGFLRTDWSPAGLDEAWR